MFRDYNGSSELQELQKQYPAKYLTVSAGRLVWEKNLDRLFDATELIKDRLGDYYHIHIGDFGELKKDLEIHAATFPHITMLPNLPQKDLALFFSLANAFLMASLSEGFGLVYVEALSCNTPVITSNISPMTDYVTDRHNGLLVDPDSSRDIGEKTIELLRNEQLYNHIRKNTRPSIMRFDSRTLQEQELEIYFDLLREF